MILVKEKVQTEKVQKNGFKKLLKRIYINTIIPEFQYINKKGEIVKPENICISL